MAAGDTVEVRGVQVRAVPAYNVDKFRSPGQPYHPREAGYVGYVVALDGVRYYHAGDTDAIPEMRDVHSDVALLPVGGTFTMTCDEACRACDMIDAQAAVPMHYADHRGERRRRGAVPRALRMPVTILPLER